jgi:hypothetical protein
MNCDCTDTERRQYSEISDLEELADALYAKIDRLREERRWIPVGERLPEENKTVLGFWGCPVTGSKSYGQAWNKSGEMTWNEGCQPTHWMPLPEPPEVK